MYLCFFSYKRRRWRAKISIEPYWRKLGLAIVILWERYFLSYTKVYIGKTVLKISSLMRFSLCSAENTKWMRSTNFPSLVLLLFMLVVQISHSRDFPNSRSHVSFSTRCVLNFRTPFHFPYGKLQVSIRKIANFLRASCKVLYAKFHTNDCFDFSFPVRRRKISLLDVNVSTTHESNFIVCFFFKYKPSYLGGRLCVYGYVRILFTKIFSKVQLCFFFFFTNWKKQQRKIEMYGISKCNTSMNWSIFESYSSPIIAGD